MVILKDIELPLTKYCFTSVSLYCIFLHSIIVANNDSTIVLGLRTVVSDEEAIVKLVELLGVAHIIETQQKDLIRTNFKSAKSDGK